MSCFFSSSSQASFLVVYSENFKFHRNLDHIRPGVEKQLRGTGRESHLIRSKVLNSSMIYRETYVEQKHSCSCHVNQDSALTSTGLPEGDLAKERHPYRGTSSGSEGPPTLSSRLKTPGNRLVPVVSDLVTFVTMHERLWMRTPL